MWYIVVSGEFVGVSRVYTTRRHCANVRTKGISHPLLSFMAFIDTDRR
jgi:hypothetical protein